MSSGDKFIDFFFTSSVRVSVNSTVHGILQLKKDLKDFVTQYGSQEKLVQTFTKILQEQTGDQTFQITNIRPGSTILDFVATARTFPDLEKKPFCKEHQAKVGFVLPVGFVVPLLIGNRPNFSPSQPSLTPPIKPTLLELASSSTSPSNLDLEPKDVRQQERTAQQQEHTIEERLAHFYKASQGEWLSTPANACFPPHFIETPMEVFLAPPLANNADHSSDVSGDVVSSEDWP